MWPIPFFPQTPSPWFVQPRVVGRITYYHGIKGWISVLECRTPPVLKDMLPSAQLGDGAGHHDFITFSLTPPHTTLAVWHPVGAYHFTNHPTDKLQALSQYLMRLQMSRMRDPDVAAAELPTRDATLRTLSQVLEARKDWLDGSDDEKEADEA